MGRSRVGRVGGINTLDSCLYWLTSINLWFLSNEGFDLYDLDGGSSRAPDSVKGWSSVMSSYTHHFCFPFKITLLQNLLTLNSVAFAEQLHSAVHTALLNQVWASSPRRHHTLFQELFFLCVWKFAFWMCAIRGVIGNWGLYCSQVKGHTYIYVFFF